VDGAELVIMMLALAVALLASLSLRGVGPPSLRRKGGVKTTSAGVKKM